jgi:hypothetical protein
MSEFLHKQVQLMGIVNTRFGLGSLMHFVMCNVRYLAVEQRLAWPLPCLDPGSCRWATRRIRGCPGVERS